MIPRYDMDNSWFRLLLAAAGAIAIASAIQLPPDPASALFSTDPARVYLFYPGSNDDSHLFYVPTDRTINASTIDALTTALPSPPKPELTVDDSNCRVTQYPYLSEDNRLHVLTTTGCSSKPLSVHRLENRWIKPKLVYEWIEVHLDSTEYGGSSLAGNFMDPDRKTLYSFGGICRNWYGSGGFSKQLLEIRPASRGGAVSALDGSPPNWPIPQAGFSVTPLIGRGKIVIIGGVTDTVHIGMQQVAVLDLESMEWSFFPVKRFSGILPRAGHTAVLTHGGSRILVYGGYYRNLNTPATPRMISLDLDAEEWEWEVVGNDNEDGGEGEDEGDTHGPDYGHAAVMIDDDVMLITGGYSVSDPEESDIVYFFNTTSEALTDSYTPKPLPVRVSNGKRNRTILICCLTVIPTVLLIGIITPVVFCWLKRRRNAIRPDKPVNGPFIPLVDLEPIPELQEPDATHPKADTPGRIPRLRLKRMDTVGRITTVKEVAAVQVLSAKPKVVKVENKSNKSATSVESDQLLELEQENLGDDDSEGRISEETYESAVEQREMV